MIHISSRGHFVHLTRRADARRLAQSGRPDHITLPKIYQNMSSEEQTGAEKSIKCIKEFFRVPMYVHLSIINVSPQTFQVHPDPYQGGLGEIIENVRFLRENFGGHWGNPSISF